MIYDSISNFKRYLTVHPNFISVSEFISNYNLSELSMSEFYICNGIKVMINEYETKELEKGIIECHRKFIDIQILLSGEEYIGINRKEKAKEKKEYNEEKDYQELSGDYCLTKLETGYFVIFYPEDGHMPGIKVENKNKVRKIVFKIPVKS